INFVAKMAKKAIDKTALRQLMKQEKQKKIDSPFAKYTGTGQLYCALCGQQLTNEMFWKAHVNGKEHKQKVLELKSNITSTSSTAVTKQQTSFVKPSPPPLPSPQQKGTKRPYEVGMLIFDCSESSHAVVVGKPTSGKTQLKNSALPDDFFDSGSTKPVTPIKSTITLTNNTKEPLTTSVTDISALPEGFFDDPHADARARKVEYVDKMEVEWESFLKEMKQESHVSDKLEMVDDAERNVDRDIKETNDLIERWQKIEDMHVKKEQILKIFSLTTAKEKTQLKVNNEINDDNIDEDDESILENELQNIYNWRQKRS
ncbi:unnamed protein product, partial [Didymodactylos carnosus]